MDITLLWIDVLLPFLTIAVPVFATVYTVNKRIENENKENHKPYLVLDKVESLKELNVYGYYLTVIGRNYLEMNPSLTMDEIILTEEDNYLPVDLIIRNIGYGVATNIKFYNLLTGDLIHGTQASSSDKNQKLFTTFDIASNEQKNMQAKVISLIKEENEIELDDHNRILCVYKDLNNHTYNFIISINIKNFGHYDFFAYQPSSKSYKKWIKSNKKQYKKIMKSYDTL